MASRDVKITEIKNIWISIIHFIIGHSLNIASSKARPSPGSLACSYKLFRYFSSFCCSWAQHHILAHPLQIHFLAFWQAVYVGHICTGLYCKSDSSTSHCLALSQILLNIVTEIAMLDRALHSGAVLRDTTLPPKVQLAWNMSQSTTQFGALDPDDGLCRYTDNIAAIQKSNLDISTEPIYSSHSINILNNHLTGLLGNK